MKKLLSLLIAAILAVSIFTTMPVSFAAGGSQTEADDNDDFSSAQLITLGNSLTGSMPSALDSDYFKFISKVDGKINISIDNLTPNETPQHGRWTFFVYDSAKKLVAMSEIDLVEKGVTLPFIGAQGGKYYYLSIWAGPGYASSHSYRIRTSFTKGKFYEKESNNSEASATKYILSKKYTGTVGGDFVDGDGNPCMDIDYFNIKAPAKGRMTINFNHKKKAPVLYNDGGWYVNLYKHNSSGNLSVSNATLRINGDADTKVYRASVDKNAEFWFTVQSGFDGNLYGDAYYYGLRSPSDVVGEPYNITSTFVLAAKPKVSTKATKNSITLTSKKLSDVTGYEIQFKSGKKFSKSQFCNKSALKYTKKPLKKNTRYTFRVRAYLKKDGAKYYGNWVAVTAKTKTK